MKREFMFPWRGGMPADTGAKLPRKPKWVLPEGQGRTEERPAVPDRQTDAGMPSAERGQPAGAGGRSFN
ncbi:hypothetical protein [Paenibacillus protaetiae]|uniref:Uncharacterized protein n=1 Tax=Paenibacillus protaetiae TaxID=2509456 RepID=A0A4P6ET05_9BACL|nr:hypothetical protein [Paenibacillus protaetiae]QAY65133.1 hypothetical protein ET464_00745 [Paenibacillus protaetiae]